ncbi:MAG: hypothetical protein HOV94_07205 [Saccharothrix sp.]|nr:hypothetical protein [Saccharothrix sp.]
MTDVPAQRGPMEHGAGVFRRIVHRVSEDARSFQHDGLTFWPADCGAVVVPTSRPAEEWPYCPACWTLTEAQREHYDSLFPDVLPITVEDRQVPADGPRHVLVEAEDEEPELVAIAVSA